MGILSSRSLREAKSDCELAGERELAPAKARIDGEHLALGVAVRARGCAYAIGRFQREQRLVAEDGVERLQAAPQVLMDLLGRDARISSSLAGCAFGAIRFSSSKACNRLQPAQELLHGVGLHVAVEQRLFRLFRELVLVVERKVAPQHDLARGRDHVLGLVENLIGHAIAKLELAHPAAGRQRHDFLFAQLAQTTCSVASAWTWSVVMRVLVP